MWNSLNIALDSSNPYEILSESDNHMDGKLDGSCGSCCNCSVAVGIFIIKIFSRCGCG